MIDSKAGAPIVRDDSGASCASLVNVPYGRSNFQVGESDNLHGHFQLLHVPLQKMAEGTPLWELASRKGKN